MNGSGANLAGCATCAGRCCRQYRVEITVPDARRLAAGTGLPLTDFVTLREKTTEGDRGFRLRRDGPVHELNLVRHKPTGACVFLMEIDTDLARCGVYAHRPLVCRNFPTTLDRGAVGIRSNVACGDDAWNLSTMDVTTYRKDLKRAEAAWRDHWLTVAEWNNQVDMPGVSVYTAEQLFSFLASPAAQTV